MQAEILGLHQKSWTTLMPFYYRCEVRPEWIDYNGHMRDAYYGLVFSYAVDAMQDEVGFDEAYRQRTGCTIYLLEDHKRFLHEVKQGETILLETYVIGVDEKRFHLHMTLRATEEICCIGEFLELHVKQMPKPHAEPIPENIRRQLDMEVGITANASELSIISRQIKLRRPIA